LQLTCSYCSTSRTRAFSVARPTAWNSLPDQSARSSCWLQTIVAGIEDVSVRRTFEALAH